MIQVGQTYEHTRTCAVVTVTGVEQVWYSYGENGHWKRKLVPRVTVMVVMGDRAVPGRSFCETVATGDLCHYGYTRLA